MTRRAWVLFIALGILWGIPYLMIRVAVRDLDPFVVAFGRTLLGSAILLPLVFKRSVLQRLLPHWKMIVVYSVIEIVIPWWLIGTAEIHLTSSTAALLLAATPLFAAILATRFGHEKLTGLRLLGLAVGFAGVATLVGFDIDLRNIPAVLAVLGAAIGYAVGAWMIGRQLKGLPPVGVITASLVVSSVIYLPFVIWRWPTGPVAPESIWSVVGLAVLCTVVAFLLMFALIAEAGAARSTVITYINPAVAIIAGIIVLSEPFTPGVAVGFPLVIIGAIMATSRARKLAG